MDNNRFIAVDTMLTGINTFKDCYKEKFSSELAEFACHMLSMVEDYIKKLPSIDAVEAVHGQWIDQRTHIVCSVCNAEYSDEIVFMNRDFEFEDLKYCPNCGARMEERVNESIL